MSDADETKEHFAERIRDATGVDITESDVRYQDGRAMLTDDAAEKIERERGTDSRVPDLHPTTETAIVGYTTALAFGAYGVATAGQSPAWATVGFVVIGLLAASIGRYYHTAEAM